MNQHKLTYIHYYLLAIATSILVWGGVEYIAICSGHNCMINTNRLWKGLTLITLIFIPITLCVWSEYVNGQLKNIFGNIKLLYEEKTLIFAIAIFISLSIASLMIFNSWWTYFVKEPASKEYMAALVNLSVFVATLFAPIAALILYDNWKIQHNKTVLAEQAKPLLKKLSQEQILIKEIINQFEMETYDPLCKFTVTDEKLKVKIKEYELLRSTNIIDFNAFANLANNPDTRKTMVDYQNFGSFFHEYNKDCRRLLKKHSIVEDEYKKKHNELTQSCKNLIKNLNSYVILK